MASIYKQLHFVLFPLMAQGHMIPVVDMARLIAERGALVSLVTTPLNAARFDTIIDRAVRGSNLRIQLVLIPFPCEDIGLPEGYENLDILPSPNLLGKFYSALSKLQGPFEEFLGRQNQPSPSCIISDKCLSWTSRSANKFGIPRIVFHGMCCFSLLSSHNVRTSKLHLSVSSDLEPFVVPGMPRGFRITRAQLPGAFVSLPDMDDVRNKMHEAESTAYGVVVNSFDELEHGCAEEYEKAVGKRVWCIGPVSLCNKDDIDKFERGNKASIDEKICMAWLDAKEPGSVVYACLGSLCRLVPSQLFELGLGLEASKRPFIWVVRFCPEVENWIRETGFEDRVKGRGLLIKGWAPQVLILSHPATGGFLTHCGWNSTLEGLSNGLPMLTWPLFSEQFFNEKLVVEIIKVGVRIGVEVPVRWGEEERVGVLVKKDDVEIAVNELMGQGEEAEERRRRAFELREMAMAAMAIGGTSYSNLSRLIDDVYELTRSREASKFINPMKHFLDVIKAKVNSSKRPVLELSLSSVIKSMESHDDVLRAVLLAEAWRRTVYPMKHFLDE